MTIADPALPRTNRPELSWPEFLAFRHGSHAFERLEAGTFGGVTLSDPDVPPEQYRAMRATPGMFALSGVQPQLGRLLTEADARPGAAPVVLVSHEVWRARYGGDMTVVGRITEVSGTPTTIVGVMPPDFRFPTNEQVWLPLRPTPAMENATERELLLFGRLAPGMSCDRARQELAAIGKTVAAEFPEKIHATPPLVRSFHDTFLGGHARIGLWLLVTAVGCVLLIACANVANLLASRGVAREREMFVRAALGAGRWRIVRQVLAESLWLGAASGGLGAAIALLGTTMIARATAGRGLPYWLSFEVDSVVFAYVAAIAVGSGLVTGLVPAWRASRVDVNPAAKSGGNAVSRLHESRLAGVSVVLQFALSVALLGCAGVLWRSFLGLQKFNPQVAAERVLTGRIFLPTAPANRYAGPEQRLQFTRELSSRLGNLPGVTHAAVASHLPGLGANHTRIEVEGRPSVSPELAPQASFIAQTPGYRALIDLPLLAGRDLQPGDGGEGGEVAVVTRAFARRHWPGESSLDKRFRFLSRAGAPGPWIRVVGECRDLVETPQSHGPSSLVFIPHEQAPLTSLVLLVRTEADPASLGILVRRAVQELDASLPVFQLQTLRSAFDFSLWMVKFLGSLFLIFALTGMLIAAVGIHAVVSHAAHRRTREIGIRIALGATRGGVLRIVLGRGIRQLAAGVTLGVAGALLLSLGLWQGGFLMQASAYDPLVLATVLLLATASGLFATWLPARRAARLAPMAALRIE